MTIKRALISVSDKNGLAGFAAATRRVAPTGSVATRANSGSMNREPAAT